VFKVDRDQIVQNSHIIMNIYIIMSISRVRLMYKDTFVIVRNVMPEHMNFRQFDWSILNLTFHLKIIIVSIFWSRFLPQHNLRNLSLLWKIWETPYIKIYHCLDTFITKKICPKSSIKFINKERVDVIHKQSNIVYIYIFFFFQKYSKNINRSDKITCPLSLYLLILRRR